MAAILEAVGPVGVLGPIGAPAGKTSLTVLQGVMVLLSKIIPSD